MQNLSSKKCIPCEKGSIAPYTKDQAEELQKEVKGWSLDITSSEFKLTKNLHFKDFRSALMMANEIGDLAEFEGHHPELYLHNWNQLQITFFTHSIKGLSENDFIMASKVNDLLRDNDLI